MRRRNLSPDFFKDEVLVELPFEHRILFEGLWCMADRAGVLEDRPKRIRMEVFPADNVDVEDGLQALDRKKKIVRYEVDGAPYIWIPTFATDQNPHPNERASTLPAYQGAPSQGVLPGLGDPPRSSQELLTRAGSSGSSGSSGPSGPSGSSGPCAKPDATGSAPVVSIPLVDGSEFAVTEAMVAEWRPAFPAVDIPQQLAQMRVWCNSNRTNRKTRSGVERFITRWLGKEQDRGGARSAGPDRNESVIEKNERARKEMRDRIAREEAGS